MCVDLPMILHCKYYSVCRLTNDFVLKVLLCV